VSDNPVYILCIETANAVTSVSISEHGSCIAVKNILEPNKAADTLHRLVESLLVETKLTFSSLSAIAISAGPGSYTGLRIASSAAKGYCFALDIPLIAISTLQAMVQGVMRRNQQEYFDEYVPMIDARRMEVFTSFYNKELECTTYFPSLILDEQCIDFFVPAKKYLLFGNGAQKAEKLLACTNVYIYKSFQHSAEDLCRLGYIEYMRSNITEIAYFEPAYYKAFYAVNKK